jgi:D-alanine-D-alanine ligase
MRIALLHNPRMAESAEPAPAGADDAFEEDDPPETIDAIAASLREPGWTVDPVLADRRLPWRLEEGRFDFVFNIAEGRGRRCREAVPAAVCELLGLPFTGSDALTLAVTLDKAIARRVVAPEVRVAPAVLVDSGQAAGRLDSLRFPVIVKPNDEGSSKGIREWPGPIAADPEQALRHCRWLHATYGCPVLVEEFLPGMEVTVGLAGNAGDVRLVGMMAIEPVGAANGPFVYSVEVKRDWQRRVRYTVPPRLPAETLEELEAAARSAWQLLGCRDLARIDFRLDGAGRPHFLECNPLPGLHPVNSDIVLLSRDTLPYRRLVQGVVHDAATRLGFALP